VPKGATHAPILLTRTPYDASERCFALLNSPHLAQWSRKNGMTPQ